MTGQQAFEAYLRNVCANPGKLRNYHGWKYWDHVKEDARQLWDKWAAGKIPTVWDEDKGPAHGLSVTYPECLPVLSHTN